MNASVELAGPPLCADAPVLPAFIDYNVYENSPAWTLINGAGESNDTVMLANAALDLSETKDQVSAHKHGTFCSMLAAVRLLCCCGAHRM